MTNRILSAATVAIALAVAASAQAQNTTDVRTSAELEDEGKRVLGADAPLSSTGSAISASAVQIAISEGEQQIALGIDFELFRSGPEQIPSPDETYPVSSLSLTVKGSTPLNNEDDEPSNFFSGGSIVGGTKVTASLTYFSSRQRSGARLLLPDPSSGGISLYREAQTACAISRANELAGNDNPKRILAARFIALIEQVEVEPTGFAQYVRLDIKEAFPELAPFSDDFGDNCTGNFDSLIATYLEDQQSRFEWAAYTDSPMFFLGASGTVGENDFKMLDRTSFVVDTVSRTPWEAEAYAGLIGASLNWSLRASASYGAAYEAPDEVEFCRTGTNGSQDCIVGPDGSPLREESGRLAFEGRYLFDLGEGNHVGIAPEVTYDLEDDDVLVEVPVYFSPNKDGQLTGGIISSYDSEDDDVTIGLFVGVPFSVAF